MHKIKVFMYNQDQLKSCTNNFINNYIKIQSYWARQKKSTVHYPNSEKIKKLQQKQINQYAYHKSIKHFKLNIVSPNKEKDFQTLDPLIKNDMQNKNKIE